MSTPKEALNKTGSTEILKLPGIGINQLVAYENVISLLL